MNSTRLLIDVRKPSEFAAGHAKDAHNLPLSDLTAGDASLEDIPKDSEIIVYCRSGNRSAMALALLEQKGFTNLTNGIDARQAEKLLAGR